MFLKEDYKPAPKSGGDYLNKFEEGDTKIRIMSDAITGWVYWTEEDNNRKPVRLKEAPEIVPVEAVQDKFGGYIKEFWAFTVWNYQESKIQLCEITQATIKDAIFVLHSSEDWGDPKQYDLTITRTDGERTSYDVIPSPPTDIPLEAAEGLVAKPVNLKALYDGKDPFEDKSAK